jgi:hypothetical protein
MGFFSHEIAQRILVPDVKKPLKEVLDEMIAGNMNTLSIRKVLGAYKALKKLPEPSENGEGKVTFQNSKALIRVRDKFLAHEEHAWFRVVFREVMNLIIILCDHCGFYKYRFKVLLELLNQETWEPRPTNRPKLFWKKEV